MRCLHLLDHHVGRGHRLNFAICYPLAYYMAQAGTAQKVRLLMLALIVPYWVNEILRAFALRLLLASKGLINQALIGHRASPTTPIDFLGNNTGLYVGLSYAYLLIMIFPLYNAIESLDKNQIEAARDLGRPLVENPPRRGHPLCQARHRLGLHHGVHARGGFARGTAVPRRPVARCGSPRSSMTSSSRPSTGRAARPMPSSCWPPASPS